VGGGLLLLLMISAGVWRLRSLRWLTVGWLWFLIAMLPVVGIVQVGEQAMADRYAYLPLIGLYILLAWGLAAIVERTPAFMARLVPALALLALLACAGGSFARVPVWRNSVTLWEAAAEAPPVHPKALYNLGLAHSRAGRYEEAIARFEGALALQPDYVKALNNLGLAREKRGDLDGARQAYTRALNHEPRHLQALINYSGLLTRAGDLPGAIELRRRAVAIDPESAVGRNNLGALLAQTGQFDEAEREFRFALRLEPGNQDARRNLALLARIRQADEKKDPPPGASP
jgi:Flp pilus assembly protein TadD